MVMIGSPVSRLSPEVYALYDYSFSKEEKIPAANLKRAMEKGAVLNVFNESWRFIGFTFSFIDGDKMFLVYFATKPELRGKGFGSQILDEMRYMYPDKRIFLVTEIKDPEAPDYDLRVRRQNYYLRNGCKETGIRVLSDDVWFDTMFVKGELTEQEMVDTIRLYEDIHNGRA
jgi:GNAT superfamily N-acetyltransferase